MKLQLAIFLLAFIAFIGAWMGFWAVRSFVLTEDGSVDISTSHFVAWSIRVLAVVLIIQVPLHRRFQVFMYDERSILKINLLSIHTTYDMKVSYRFDYCHVLEFSGSLAGSRSFNIWNNCLVNTKENF